MRPTFCFLLSRMTIFRRHRRNSADHGRPPLSLKGEGCPHGSTLPTPSPVSTIPPNGGLGGDLLLRPLLSSLRLHRRGSCKAKITNMSNHVIIQENIAWLEITVNNWQWSVLVKIIKCRSHINCDAEPSGTYTQGP